MSGEHPAKAGKKTRRYLIGFAKAVKRYLRRIPEQDSEFDEKFADVERRINAGVRRTKPSSRI